MPRPIITTTFTPRVKPTTEYTRPRDGDCITWDEATFTWDSTSLTWDEFCSDQITTSYTTPRKGTLLQDLTLELVTDLLGANVDGLTGIDGNIIVTKWT